MKQGMANISARLQAPVSIAPLVVFRIIFGAMMLLATLRFMAKGWIDLLYIQPRFFFHYWGFSWIKTPLELGLPAWSVYAVYVLMAAAALGIILGWRYRLSALGFFLLFSYTELWDLTNYLNHYYFTSLMSGLMVLLPAHRSYSLDVRRNPALAVTHVPAWTIGILRLQLAVVYFYAGLAKLQADWLLHAQPLRLWLPARAYMPVIGPWLKQLWVAYFFSWFGCLYDLTIPFFLSWRKTRPLAYVAVVAFHVLTWVLFPIGMFPWIMILSTLIFFSSALHEKVLKAMQSISRWRFHNNSSQIQYNFRQLQQPLMAFLGLFILFQLLFPFRYALYPGNAFWTEQGYRFSWRVMLMEKSGTTIFYVENSETGNRFQVKNEEFLNPQQEKMMATQPDMILQFARHLKQHYTQKGVPNPKIYAESWVTLNGRALKPYIRPDVDLASLEDSWAPKDWILPLDEPDYRAER